MKYIAKLSFCLIIILVTACKKDIQSDSHVDDGFDVFNINTNQNTSLLKVIVTTNIEDVSSWGICFSNANTEPNLNDSVIIISNDSVNGKNVYLENLQPNTKYYIRIFTATNSAITYSDTYQIKTTNPIGALANLNHLPITYIYNDSAVLNFEIFNNGGSEIIENGFCISRYGTPNITDRKIELPTNSSNLSTPLYKLAPSTIYYVRPYVINSAGTVYGKQRVFITDSISINQFMKGGSLFYIFKKGDQYYVENEFHGLVYYPMLTIGINHTAWSNNNTLITTNNTSIGGGEENTKKIIQTLGQGNYMAWRVDSLTFRNYNDWYLVSKEELDLIVKTSGNVVNNIWTSTEYDSLKAYAKVNGLIQPVLKSQKYRSVIVRRF